jgi:hypothetical protein
MKNTWTLYITFLFTSIVAANITSTPKVMNGYENGISFSESGITFNLMKNGEFDFFLDSFADQTSIYYQGNGVNISYNSGFNYSPYVQIDRFGAIIQIENTPIFYDYYGRVSQIGTIHINYRNRFINRVGGLNVFYNINGFYSHCTGFINYYNPRYTYRPYYSYFRAPRANYCVVRPQPYRRHYRATRNVYRGKRTYKARTNRSSYASAPRNANIRPRTSSNSTRNVNVKPRTSSTKPRAIASTPRNVNVKPRTSSTRPRTIASTPRNVNVKPRTSSTRPRAIASTPRNINSKKKITNTRPRTTSARNNKSISSRNSTYTRNRTITSRSTRSTRSTRR